MKEFFDINTKKFALLMLSIALLMAVLLGIICFFGYRAGQFSVTGVIICITLVPLAMALFLSPFAIYGWMYRLRKREHALKIQPFNLLHQIGFRPCYFDHRGSINIAERSVSAQFKGFTVLFDVLEQTDKKPIIEFIPLVKKTKPDRQQITRIVNSFIINPVWYMDKKFKRFYPVGEEMDINLINKQLLEFVILLKSEGFTPDEDATIQVKN